MPTQNLKNMISKICPTKRGQANNVQPSKPKIGQASKVKEGHPSEAKISQTS